MALVEQAVFTSAETERSTGYQVVAQSPGVCDADARELAVWGPSHDSLLDSGADAVSFNFHPLPSGAYCVSRTSPAGWEYSGRGGHRVYTQCLIVPAEMLGRFANNPFAIARAATAGGLWEAYEHVPSQLEPLMLCGGAASVDQNLLAQLAINPGAQQMATLVQAALDSLCLAVDAGIPIEHLVAGLLNCLPTACRGEFSFSTGLKFSSRRPYRIVALPSDPAERRWLAHQNNMTALDLSAAAPLTPIPIDGWARLIGRVLASGRLALLAAQLAKQQGELSLPDLSALGLQLLEDFDAAALHGVEKAETKAEKPTNPFSAFSGRSEPDDESGPTEDNEAANETSRAPSSASETLQHAHAAHHRFRKSSEPDTTAKPNAPPPSKYLEANAPEVLERLELLDDLVFGAIGGRADSLEELAVVWRAVLSELGEELVAESREQYLLYALAIWEQCTNAGGMRDAARAVQALDVLCLLFGEGNSSNRRSPLPPRED